MEFAAKLKQLTADENKSKLARAAGLSSTAISDYLQKGYIPRADKAIKLARALDVPTDWLFDDEADFPVPSAKKNGAANLTDDELMLEVSRRWRIHAVRYLDLINKGEKVDWSAVAEEVLKLPLGSEPPARLQWQLRLAAMLDGFHQDLLRYEPSIAALAFDGIPGSDLNPDDLMMDFLTERWHRIRESSPGWQIVRDWFAISNNRRSPIEAKDDEEWRKRSIERIASFRQRSKALKPE
jgi:transcriptional regulator with XRE-family HTH domain